MALRGRAILVVRENKRVETHEFESAAEAIARLRIVAEALSWIGTPFKNCSDVKGARGGVDCAMLLVRSYVDTGRLRPFDPRPYPPQWHVNQREQRFLGWVHDQLGGREIETPRLGDVAIYQYGRCFSHGGIVINQDEIVHAYAKSEICHVSLMTETDLCFLPSGKPRPRMFFEVGSRA
jgi:cell wall-associated NlpC family hydrolase